MAPSAIEPEVSIEKIPIKPWSRPALTEEKLDWAPLVEIDLSRFDEPGGKEALAKQLYDAVTRVGFWVVTGHGLSEERVLRQFSIGNAFFKEPLEEKRSFACNFAEGEYFGYRENERWIGDTGVKDNIEMVCIEIVMHRYMNLVNRNSSISRKQFLYGMIFLNTELSDRTTMRLRSSIVIFLIMSFENCLF
jgi:hypothetical protein